MAILKRLDNRRICARWALKMLIDENEEFYATGMQRLTQSWKTGFIMKKNLWKNNFSFVKMYTNHGVEEESEDRI